MTLYDREERDVVRLPESEIRRKGDEESVLPTPTPPIRTLSTAIHAGSRSSCSRGTPTASRAGCPMRSATPAIATASPASNSRAISMSPHPLNAYLHYRWSDRTSVSLKYRAGSNFPIPGYWEYREPHLGPNFGALARPVEDPDGPPLGYVVSDERNRTRLPFYSPRPAGEPDVHRRATRPADSFRRGHERLQSREPASGIAVGERHYRTRHRFDRVALPHRAFGRVARGVLRSEAEQSPRFRRRTRGRGG